METWDAIRVRRNTREYQDRSIDPADLDRILEGGRRSPSSMNEQPWDFIAVTDRATLERMADLWRWTPTRARRSPSISGRPR
jgi:nitroreductase